MNKILDGAREAVTVSKSPCFGFVIESNMIEGIYRVTGSWAMFSREDDDGFRKNSFRCAAAIPRPGVVHFLRSDNEGQ